LVKTAGKNLGVISASQVLTNEQKDQQIQFPHLFIQFQWKSLLLFHWNLN